MLADVLGAFDESYTKPQRCGHETRRCFRNKDMKDSINASNRWYVVWFLKVMEICPHEVGSPKEWLRIP
jgi:hypothetical protein